MRKLGLSLIHIWYRRAEKLAYVDAYEQLYRECMEKKECLTIRQLAVSGQDLIAAGMQPGKQIGEMLNELPVSDTHLDVYKRQWQRTTRN